MNRATQPQDSRGRDELFAIPVGHAFLLYAPLSRLSAVLNRAALAEVHHSLEDGAPSQEAVREIFDGLSLPPDPAPTPRSGDLREPFFLGILPTRGCNLACRYCDFLSGATRVMDLDTARRAVDAYLQLLIQNQISAGAIHFFGGEPFYAPQVVQFVVEYARAQAAREHLRLHFEATTNGCYPDALANWISANLDTVVLSFDGPADVQNAHRPLRSGAASFERVSASAAIFAAGDCELVLRACVSAGNVERLPEIAAWYARDYHPSVVCFEPLSVSESARKNHLLPPEPLAYARRFSAAADVLEPLGIRTILSTADLSQKRVTPCPVGNDALIVTPEGQINACYLLEKQWQAAGFDLSLGKVTAGGFQFEPGAVQRMRAFSVLAKPLCADCFCRYHCAGGCHVNHFTGRPAGQYDDQCLRTRLVSAAHLLDALGQRQLRADWLADDDALRRTAWQSSDRLSDLEAL